MQGGFLNGEKKEDKNIVKEKKGKGKKNTYFYTYSLCYSVPSVRFWIYLF